MALGLISGSLSNSFLGALGGGGTASGLGVLISNSESVVSEAGF